jgi:hypothetical protein
MLDDLVAATRRAGRRSGASRRARARRRRFGLDRDRLTALTAIALYTSLAALVTAIARSLSS